MASVLVTSATPQVRDCEVWAGATAAGGRVEPGFFSAGPGSCGVTDSKAGGSVNTTILSTPRPPGHTRREIWEAVSPGDQHAF